MHGVGMSATIPPDDEVSQEATGGLDKGTSRMGDSAPAFSLRAVRQVRDDLTTLDEVNVEIPRGRITTLIGPSGAGKSALLRLLNRLDDPVSGEIHYGGRPISDYAVRALRCRVGFVFQVSVPFPGTVRDNLTLAAEIAGLAPGKIDDRILANIGLADLDRDLLSRDASRLSVGQMQRVGIARALMTDPETLLLDEPTASLDPETADTLGKTISGLSSERGLTVVMASHRLLEARRLSHYSVMLDKGKVIEAGPAADLFDSSHPRLRAFLDRVN